MRAPREGGGEENSSRSHAQRLVRAGGSPSLGDDKLSRFPVYAEVDGAMQSGYKDKDKAQLEASEGRGARAAVGSGSRQVEAGAGVDGVCVCNVGRQSQSRVAREEKERERRGREGKKGDAQRRQGDAQRSFSRSVTALVYSGIRSKLIHVELQGIASAWSRRREGGGGRTSTAASTRPARRCGSQTAG